MMVDWSALKSFRRRLIRKKENARTDLTENEESDSEEDEENYKDILDLIFKIILILSFSLYFSTKYMKIFVHATITEFR